MRTVWLQLCRIPLIMPPCSFYVLVQLSVTWLQWRRVPVPGALVPSFLRHQAAGQIRVVSGFFLIFEGWGL